MKKCTCHPSWRPHFGVAHHPNCAQSKPRPTYFGDYCSQADKAKAREVMLANEALWDE